MRKGQTLHRTIEFKLCIKKCKAVLVKGQEPGTLVVRKRNYPKRQWEHPLFYVRLQFDANELIEEFFEDTDVEDIVECYVRRTK